MVCTYLLAVKKGVAVKFDGEGSVSPETAVNKARAHIRTVRSLRHNHTQTRTSERMINFSRASTHTHTHTHTG